MCLAQYGVGKEREKCEIEADIQEKRYEYPWPPKSFLVNKTPRVNPAAYSALFEKEKGCVIILVSGGRVQFYVASSNDLVLITSS